jgi:hypothetical protein
VSQSATQQVRVLDLPTEFNGFVFHCNAQTRDECLERNLFGCPSGGQYGPHSKAKAGDLLFLADFSSWTVTGVFVASSNARMHIDKAAWGGRFPWQIKVQERGPSHPKLKTVHIDRVNEILGLVSGSKLNRLTPEQLTKLLCSKEFGPCVPAHLYKVKTVPVGTVTVGTVDASSSGEDAFVASKMGGSSDSDAANEFRESVQSSSEY